ncbi:MAG: sulfurtransferase-like selenium metabolism protein YedF [Nitrospirae bacterium]|nr:MAG: sulfurtransferase-like selenium metabolism protein YedF [Nitrospirota bacterium]
MVKIDARGLGCPKPVVMADDALQKLSEGTVEVLVDNEASVKNLEKFAKKSGFTPEVIPSDGYWAVRITKGYTCEIIKEDASTEPNEQKGLLMVIGTDTLGKDEALGGILMKGFLETMKVTGELPDMIFFLNAGVKLTTTNEETVTVLKEMESKGVEIFSCGTCLKHYGLEDSLRVGYRGTTNHIVEGMQEFKKVVWI